MKTLLKLEEAGQLLLAIILFSQLNYDWWLFPALILLPDISMLGYLVNPKVGAWTYNCLHHKAVAVVVFTVGIICAFPVVTLIGIILFGHSALDRILGYGLKFQDRFNHTHLGNIGKSSNN